MAIYKVYCIIGQLFLRKWYFMNYFDKIFLKIDGFLRVVK